MTRRTKIVATIGPASTSDEVLDEVLAAGVDVVRLNLSHGPVEEHLARLTAVRAAAVRAGRVVGVLADLPGPKVRAGRFPEAGAVLLEGHPVALVPGDGDSTAQRITVDYPTLLDDVAPGDRVVLGDGALSLRVDRVDGAEDCVCCTVENGGRTTGRPGVHLPSERFRLNAPTAEDLVLAKAMADAGVDFIGLSFVRSAADVRQVREAIAPSPAHLVAKIETTGAINDLSAIAATADAVMVARGDLGIEWPLEDVPHLQKHIIRHCVAVGVPVITATQMLESMIHAPAPTRAEVSDVANAVFDGTDAVMLSGETAIGDHPALVVRTMARIAERAEQEGDYRQWAKKLGRQQTRSDSIADPVTDAITHAAWQAANELEVDAIICSTRSGRTARAMARFRPITTLLGMSPDPHTVRTLSLVWGVVPLQVDTYDSTDNVVWHTVEKAVQHGAVVAGHHVLVLAGAPDRPSGAATDVLRIVKVE
jgi:pyruvate kinase